MNWKMNVAVDKIENDLDEIVLCPLYLGMADEAEKLNDGNYDCHWYKVLDDGRVAVLDFRIDNMTLPRAAVNPHLYFSPEAVQLYIDWTGWKDRATVFVYNPND